MQAFADGKEIEYSCDNRNWHNAGTPLWDWSNLYYRIKPEPKYRPYKDAKEFVQAQKEHGLYLTFGKGVYRFPIEVYDYTITIYKFSAHDTLSYEELLKYTWQDGTPCGVKEE